MKFVAVNMEHDGALAIVDDGRLIKCIEAQKDNHPRHSRLRPEHLGVALEEIRDENDVFAVGGWFSHGNYEGVDPSVISVRRVRRKGKRIVRLTTSHERAHIFCAYGLSPFEQGRPCYALVWEGTLGAFYRIDDHCRIEPLCFPMTKPGHRYAFLYELAHPEFSDESRGWSKGVAGKLMALASHSDSSPLKPHERDLMIALLDQFDSHTRKRQLQSSPFWNSGCTREEFRCFAYKFSAAMFDRFYLAIKQVVAAPLPLLIAGGCGLNCDWNNRWRDCGLFSEVFVPPCADDSGIAIGVAVDAQRHFEGRTKLEWSVYSGDEFEHDISVHDRFQSFELNYDVVARLLMDGAVIAWVNGRYEIGPRALGNRSLLAAPFSKEIQNRLNEIKKREDYRPIAPVCIEQQVSQWFAWNGPSPHMLYFQRVLSDRLKGVTHDDGTARVQTVNARENEKLYKLLTAFLQRSGLGVLCNTSLNYPGRGFINRMSDLAKFVEEKQIEGMVVDDRLYVPITADR